MSRWSRVVAAGLSALMLLGMPVLSGAQEQARRNERGIAFNHVSVIATGPLWERETAFWEAMGGARNQPGPARFVIFSFQDMSVTVRDVEGSGGTAGSIVDHIGFQVPDTVAALERFRAAGLNAEAGNFPGQGWLVSPVGVRVEILQDPNLDRPLRGHHVHFNTTASLEMQAWYARIFGAVPGKRGNFDAADITANTTVMNLTFSTFDTPTRVSTKGRAFARIGFQVTGLPQMLDRLREQGVTIDRPMEIQQNGRTGIAYIMDPWGTWIELIDQNAGPGS